MKIKLDNLDKKDGSVTVTCDDQAAAKHDQSIQGSRWEAPGDMDIAYAIIQDKPGLIAELEEEGYELDTDEYCEPSDWEELKSWMQEEL